MTDVQGAYRNLHMNGQEVFKFAVRAVPTVRPLPARSHDTGAALMLESAWRATSQHCQLLVCEAGRLLLVLVLFQGVLLAEPCAQVIEAALSNAGMEKKEVDWLVMHQANMRIMSAAADRLGVPAGEQRVQ
jgi:hypothetical protein